MEFGNWRSGKLGLAEVVQDRGDLLVLVNAMRALHDVLDGGIPALIEMCEVITARDNFTRDFSNVT
jgi:hypothetical protein